MKNILKSFIKFIFLLVFLTQTYSCNKECVENPGATIEREIILETFDKLIVFHGVEVYISQGDTQKIVVKTGEHKQDNVYFELVDNTLKIEAYAACMFSPTYDPITVYITSPMLTSIRNSGEFTIHSIGELHFPSLELLVENHNSNYSNIGNIDLTLQSTSVQVISNGFSNVTLKGTTDYLYLGYYSGVGIFDGKELIAQEVDFFHRAENTLSVNPVARLSGELYSVGNIKVFSHPPIVEVTQHYTGRLIYE